MKRSKVRRFRGAFSASAGTALRNSLEVELNGCMLRGMRGGDRLKWLWALLLIVLAFIVACVLLVRREVSNVMHPALDTLAAVPLSERWAHPALLQIRALGVKSVPDLRR